MTMTKTTTTLWRNRRRLLLRWTTTLLLICTTCLASSEKTIAEEEQLVKVLIGFSSAQEKETFTTQAKLGEGIFSTSFSNPATFKKRKVVPFERTNAIATSLTETEYEALQQEMKQQTDNHGRIKYMVPDYPVRLYQNNNNGDDDFESIPYGIAAVLQATDNANDVFDNNRIPLPPPVVNQDDCFRVCVVDSGLFLGHPDMPFDTDDGNFRLTGEAFDLPKDQEWFNPDPATSGHGTHVTGTIFAEGQNGEGVVGVIHNPQGICLSIARVFADGEPSTSTSSINEGIEWCADQGSRVINLSLGRLGSPEQASQELFDQLWDDGILVVAAAGNEGNNQKSYPASYDNVISVAAVDIDNEHAGFSQENDAVDLSGPGVSVLSTSGGGLFFRSGDVGLSDLNARVHAFSRFIQPDDDPDIVTDTLELADCDFGFDACANAQGKACIIERGETFFWEKALNCQAGDGVLALIFNNEEGIYFGSVTEENGRDIDIPVLSLTRQEGLDLLNGPMVASIELREFGYAFQSGTSMASPHVAGVAAKIWAARPQCSNEQVQEALFATALRLGDPKDDDKDGRDDMFGYGLVQAVDAYQYLLTFDDPCGLVGGDPTDSPSHKPTFLPSNVPTLVPTPVPTTASPSMSPTDLPSLYPTGSPSSSPIGSPSAFPSKQPTIFPSSSPTKTPTLVPSSEPTDIPSASPTEFPTASPSDAPTLFPTFAPSEKPTGSPTLSPSNPPTMTPSLFPSKAPTSLPSVSPTEMPSRQPSETPSWIPTTSSSPTDTPSLSLVPTTTPEPSLAPQGGPSPTRSADQFDFEGIAPSNDSPASPPGQTSTDSANIGSGGVTATTSAYHIFFHMVVVMTIWLWN